VYVRRLALITGVIMALALLLSGCAPEEDAAPPIEYADTPPQRDTVYVFAIHPLYSPGRLFEKFAPLIDHLNRQFDGFALELEASRDYPAYDRKIRSQRPDFLLPNPFQTLIGLKHGYHVIGKVDDDENFRGIILVRRADAIRKVTDLRGGVIAAPGPTALAATMMPKYYLQTHGLDVKRDVRYLYTGTQESTMMALVLGNARAATTWPIPWRLFQRQRPDLAGQLRVAWRTDTLPSNSVMAHERVPKAVADQVIQALIALSQTEKGRRLLQESTFTGFVAATDKTYEPVRAFLRRYSELVEPVEIE